MCPGQLLAQGKYMTGQSPDAFLPLTTVSFEILLALADGPRHGYDVMVAIEERTSGRVSLNPGTLYRALDRLVHQGLLDVGERRVGASDRRVFKLSRLGARVASSEARRLADQVAAARVRRLLPHAGDL
jgi:DNA-binding PadR family transcriptional regulator